MNLLQLPVIAEKMTVRKGSAIVNADYGFTVAFNMISSDRKDSIIYGFITSSNDVDIFLLI
jgi:hypothetical protein